ncbi:hypothetical protein FNH22_31360, partial [Fulvivirga sp. M361]
TYDTHGSMLSMPHLTSMAWDFADRLQTADLGGGGMAYYVYDAQGDRVRKVIERNGGVKEERSYLGGWEVYRKSQNGTLELERETLHMMDDERRIALVDSLTVDNATILTSPAQLIRYQLDNHLNSAGLELDDTAAVISYEEYYPFGTTSYRSGRSTSEVTLKRYRYVGKERDDETGLYYYGARYYAGWLARFVSVDPLKDDYPFYTPYQYAGNKPITFFDLDGLEEAKPDENVNKRQEPSFEDDPTYDYDAWTRIENDQFIKHLTKSELERNNRNAFIMLGTSFVLGIAIGYAPEAYAYVTANPLVVGYYLYGAGSFTVGLLDESGQVEIPANPFDNFGRGTRLGILALNRSVSKTKLFGKSKLVFNRIYDITSDKLNFFLNKINRGPLKEIAKKRGVENLAKSEFRSNILSQLNVNDSERGRKRLLELITEAFTGGKAVSERVTQYGTEFTKRVELVDESIGYYDVSFIIRKGEEIPEVTTITFPKLNDQLKEYIQKRIKDWKNVTGN